MAIVATYKLDCKTVSGKTISLTAYNASCDTLASWYQLDASMGIATANSPAYFKAPEDMYIVDFHPLLTTGVTGTVQIYADGKQSVCLSLLSNLIGLQTRQLANAPIPVAKNTELRLNQLVVATV